MEILTLVKEYSFLHAPYIDLLNIIDINLIILYWYTFIQKFSFKS